MSPFKCFLQKWAQGCGTESCQRANNVVFSRGKVPCHVLFVGEAPGESEDTCGVPFIGPAGRLLDQIIRKSIPDPDVVRYAITNLVCCIPRNPDEGGKAAEPLPEDITSCAPRLREFVTLCNPKLIVAVGSLARDWLDPKLRGSVWTDMENGRKHPGALLPQVHIVHPAALLRQNIAQRGLSIQRCEITVANAVEELCL